MLFIEPQMLHRDVDFHISPHIVCSGSVDASVGVDRFSLCLRVALDIRQQLLVFTFLIDQIAIVILSLTKLNGRANARIEGSVVVDGVVLLAKRHYILTQFLFTQVSFTILEDNPVGNGIPVDRLFLFTKHIRDDSFVIGVVGVDLHIQFRIRRQNIRNQIHFLWNLYCNVFFRSSSADHIVDRQLDEVLDVRIIELGSLNLRDDRVSLRFLVVGHLRVFIGDTLIRQRRDRNGRCQRAGILQERYFDLKSIPVHHGIDKHRDRALLLLHGFICRRFERGLIHGIPQIFQGPYCFFPVSLFQ